jgi:murein DD-endopeptidase MepM/ murein hydrolase activator NlpD
VSISTLLKKLIGWPPKATAALAKTTKKIFKGLKNIKPMVKEDFGDTALNTREAFLRTRKKTIALFRRPMKDVSHVGIIVVISLALFSGLSAMFGTTDEVAVNPFVAQQAKAERYVSSSEKRLLEADSVATVAMYHSDSLGQDAAQTAESLGIEASTNTGGSKYIASVPIVQIDTSSSGNKIVDYVVQNGDTLSTIGSKFNVSTDTLRYANQIEDIDSIKPGQTLTIPPVTGILHTVANGDTTAGIATKYRVSEALIIAQNELYGEDLIAGAKIMVPDAEIPEPPKPKVVATSVASSASRGTYGSSGYIGRTGSFGFPTYPISGNCGPGIYSTYQSYHSYWAWDICNRGGTPIFASDSGRIESANYSGGYGYNIVIDHGDGFKTLYAHMSSFAVYGGYVSKGQIIGYMGSTGWSTGTHLHFEVYYNGTKVNPGNYL